jgi:hypothetical protein
MITGDNLLFLREPVKINNMETWLTKEQEDKKIVVMRRGTTITKRSRLSMSQSRQLLDKNLKLLR